MENNEIIYSWTFSSEKSRGSMWYIIALSIVIGLVIWGFLTKQYGMSFIILLLSGLVFFVENNSSKNITVNITPLGIHVGDSFYDFSHIDSFNIIYEGENAVLLRLNLNKKGLRYIDLNIDNNNVLDIKNVVGNYVENSSKGELSFIEKITRLLKL